MDKESVKNLVYGGVSELMNDRRFYYRSTINLSYNHFTDEGVTALTEYMKLMSYKMIEAEEAELNSRAKQLVLKELKGKTI